MKRLFWAWIGCAVLVLGGHSVAVAQTPPADDNSASALLQEALREITYLSFERAGELYDQVLAKVPAGSPQWEEALFGRGMCAQQHVPLSAESIALAQRLYRQLLDQKPDSRFAPRVLMNLGRIEEMVDYYPDQPHLPEARIWYEKVATGWPDTPIGSEAALRSAACLIQSYQPANARAGVEYLRLWLAAHGKNALASAMWQYMGDTYFQQFSDWSAAVDCYIKAVEAGLIEKGREGMLYWRMAVVAERAKRPEVAITYYTKIIKEAPTSGKAYQSQLALARLGATVPRIELFDTMGQSDEPAASPATSPAPATQPGGTR